MAKRQFTLTTQEVSQLLYAYQHCKDGTTRTRYQAVRLYGTGYPAQEVMDITGCGRTTLMTWCRLYRQHNADILIDKRMGGNSAKLTPAQVQDLAQVITRWYGVNYRSRSAYLSLFDRCGFSYQRPERVFKSRREAQVAAFQEELEKNC